VHTLKDCLEVGGHHPWLGADIVDLLVIIKLGVNVAVGIVVPPWRRLARWLGFLVMLCLGLWLVRLCIRRR